MHAVVLHSAEDATAVVRRRTCHVQLLVDARQWETVAKITVNKHLHSDAD